MLARVGGGVLRGVGHESAHPTRVFDEVDLVQDQVERIGIARSWQAIGDADAVLPVLDEFASGLSAYAQPVFLLGALGLFLQWKSDAMDRFDSWPTRWQVLAVVGALTAIAALPGELITGIQLNDGTLVPQNTDYYTDCLANRRPMGDGEFDIAAFLDAVRSTGTQAGWSLEVPNSWGWEHADEHVAAIGAGVSLVMAERPTGDRNSSPVV